MYSVPRSTPRTADAAEAVDEKRRKRPNSMVAGESCALRRPGGAMLCICAAVREVVGVHKDYHKSATRGSRRLRKMRVM